MAKREDFVVFNLLLDDDSLEQQTEDIVASGIGGELLVESLKSLYDHFVDDHSISGIGGAFKQDAELPQ